MEEKKFYIVDADYMPDDRDNYSVSNEEFKKIVEKRGWTLTPEQIAAEITEDANYAPCPQTHIVRYL